MTPEQAALVVHQSLRDLFTHDSKLLINDVSERAITHKLAEHLWNRVRDLCLENLDKISVDCEYNRNAEKGYGEPKEVCLLTDKVRTAIRGRDPILEDAIRAVTTYPDIIVHERETNKNNLLVIELKKADSDVSHDLDIAKLTAFTERSPYNSYCYHHGLFIILSTGRRRAPSATLQWISRGIVGPQEPWSP